MLLYSRLLLSINALPLPSDHSDVGLYRRTDFSPESTSENGIDGNIDQSAVTGN